MTTRAAQPMFPKSQKAILDGIEEAFDYMAKPKAAQTSAPYTHQSCAICGTNWEAREVVPCPVCNPTKQTVTPAAQTSAHPPSAGDEGLCEIQALADAVQILNTAREKTADRGDAPWQIVYDASQYLNKRLTDLLRAPIGTHAEIAKLEVV